MVHSDKFSQYLVFKFFLKQIKTLFYLFTAKIFAIQSFFYTFWNFLTWE